MKLNRVLLIALIAFVLPAESAWCQTKIDLSAVKLSILDKSFEGRDLTLPVDQVDKEEKLIIRAGGADVSASFKIKKAKNSRARGVRLNVKYRCDYLGDLGRNKQELFFPADTIIPQKIKVKFKFGKGDQELQVLLEFDAMVN